MAKLFAPAAKGIEITESLSRQQGGAPARPRWRALFGREKRM